MSQTPLIPFLNAIRSIPMSRNTALKNAETGLMPRPLRIGSKLFYSAKDWNEWLESGCRPIALDWHPKKSRDSR